MRKNKMFKSQSSELSDWEKVENLCIRSKPSDRISASEVKSILLANSNNDMKAVAKKCQKTPKSSQNGKNPPKIPDLVKKSSGVNAIINDMDTLKVEDTETKENDNDIFSDVCADFRKEVEKKFASICWMILDESSGAYSEFWAELYIILTTSMISVGVVWIINSQWQNSPPVTQLTKRL